MTITTWHRLEPVPRSSDLRPGLRAELADPLWLLGRQWQFGEFAGEDAGSPVESVARVEVAPITRFRPGASGTAVDIDEVTLPLETAVERRPLAGTPAGLRHRVEAGLHFLRLLSVHGAAANQRQRWTEAFPVDADDLADAVADDPAGQTWLATVRGRAPDGAALARVLGGLQGQDGALDDVPDEVSVPAAQRDRVLAAARDWLAWWASAVEVPPDDTADAWNPRRLEYAFAMQAGLSDGDVVLRADDYAGGRLDWYEFEADHRGSLGRPDGGAEPRTLVRRTLPSRAFYGGMPADRFWEFEPSSVRFGGATGRTDLAHLLLDEFALGYGNDWFVVPLTLPAGSVTAVRELTVVDSFGVETTVGPGRADGWRMFDVSRRPGAAARVDGLLHLSASLPLSQQGDPIEEVAWFRDEMANVVWAVERRTESVAGGHVDRYERAQSGLEPGAAQRVPGDVGDATLVYRLNSRVPANWHPLVPVRPPGAQPGVVELELRAIERVGPDGTVATTPPRGRFLTSASPLVVAEEEIARQGRETQLHWQLTRGADGGYHAWLSHRVHTGRGEGSSGLVFDVSRPVG